MVKSIIINKLPTDKVLTIDDMRNTILQGHVLDFLTKIPDESIDLICTSVPYWGLRDYKTQLVTWSDGWVGELGQESTYQAYINHLMEVFLACKRVLKKTGSIWINIGDSFYGGGQASGHTSKSTNLGVQTDTQSYIHKPIARGKQNNIQNKSLVGIPDRLKIAMIDAGFVCRNEIIWFKPSCKPSSAKDRFTVDFEKFFFFTLQQKYFFKQQLEPSDISAGSNWAKWSKKHNLGIGGKKYLNTELEQSSEYIEQYPFRNKRTVWKINPEPATIEHFAVFPKKLITIPIDACCPKEICNKCLKPRETIYHFEKTELIENYQGQALKDYKGHNAENPSDLKRRTLESQSKALINTELSSCNCKAGFKPGIVLDPFSGSGTTGLEAYHQEKDFILCELNPKYVAIAKDRLKNLKKRILDFVNYSQLSASTTNDISIKASEE